MRVIATDDDARRQVFKWLGPVDAALPVPARLAAVAWAVVLVPTFSFLAWTLTPFVDLLGLVGPLTFLFHSLLSLALGAGSAIWLIRAVGKRVTPETPLRHLFAVWRGELNAPRPVADTIVRVVSAPARTLWVEDDPRLATTHTVTSPLRFDDDD